MFETFCAFLLRLYPARFREAYGSEALRLMRDRGRDERGVCCRARLLTDLVLDVVATRFRGWRVSEPLFAPVGGAPRFAIIDVHQPSPAALTVGAMASILMFAAFTHRLEATPLAAALASLSGRPLPAEAAAAKQLAQQFEKQQAIADERKARHDIVAAVAASLKARYHDHAIGQRLSDAIRDQARRGSYHWLGTGASLAARLNADIQKTARTLSVPRGSFVADVVYMATPPPSGQPAPRTEQERARQRARLLAQNCWIEKAGTLEDKVGYLKLKGFADVGACQETVVRTMASLNDAQALIVDVRDNGGGFGETALLIAGYLFDRPAFLFDPRPNSPVPPRTASPVSGNKLADKPVYVLTSSRTQSAAEYLAYNLRMLKRATIVGETTAGRQHSGRFHRLTDHVGLVIQEVAPPQNPYPVKGWEVIGVEPDVETPATDALETARRLAQAHVRRR